MDKIVTFRKIRNLIKNDGKNIFRDPMFILILFAPILLTIVVYVGVPFLTGILKKYLSFDLTAYYPVIIAFMTIIPGYMCGLLVGFMLLDDKDEKILLQISVSPFGLVRYLSYRIIFLAVFCFIITFLYLLFIPLLDFSLLQIFFTSINVALDSIFLTLFLAAFASNKVEGLAYAKLLGLVIIGPITAFFIPAPYHVFTAFLPTYWNGIVLYNSGILLPIYGLIGIVVHLVFILILAKKFKKLL